MATAKKTVSTVNMNDEQISQAVSLFKLAADATRLKILQTVGARETNVGALCVAVGMTQPAVSHHLGWLRMSQLVEARRQGKNNFYRLLPLGEKVIRAMASLSAA